jgi:hypothetical protein
VIIINVYHLASGYRRRFGCRTTATTCGLPDLANPLEIVYKQICFQFYDRVAGPDTTTDSVSDNGDDLTFGLPDLANPLEIVLKTNLYSISRSGRGSGYHQRFGVGQRRRPHIWLARPRKPPRNCFKTNLFPISRSGRGSGYHHRFGVGQRRRPHIWLARPRKPSRNCLQTNLFPISRSGRESGYHNRFGVAQRQSPRNRTPRPRKPLKTFFHQEFIVYYAIGSRIRIPPPIRCRTKAITSESDAPTSQTP